LAARHGSAAREVLGEARTLADLGPHFGASLYAREVDHLVTNEWALTADDILWRRTKAGLALDDAAQQALARYVAARGRTREPLFACHNRRSSPSEGSHERCRQRRRSRRRHGQADAFAA